MYIDAEPNFLAQMRIFHSGTVCVIAAHASEPARVLRGTFGPDIALQQAQAFIATEVVRWGKLIRAAKITAN